MSKSGRVKEIAQVLSVKQSTKSLIIEDELAGADDDGTTSRFTELVHP
jgi:hypothetical protein